MASAVEFFARDEHVSTVSVCVCEREKERERASTRVISVKCSRYPHCHRRPKRVAGNVTGARLYLVT